MDRRKFIKLGAGVCAVPLATGGLTTRAYGLPALSALSSIAQTDRVLVVLRLGGGNDGLNTVLALDQYANLAKARANILIPEAKALKLNTVTGLHPSLTGMHNLYKEGKLQIIQAVGYPSHNQSHFRSTDIWFSGSDYNNIVSTGWLGRYLDSVYPGYPEGYPTPDFPDPPAIQIGSSLLGLLQGPEVPMGFAVADPTSIYSLVPAGTDTAPSTPAGHELTFIRLIATETQKYGESIKKALAAATNKSSLYPATGNRLSDQLKAVARLIAGGLQTKIYVVEANGFDTHANQVDAADDNTTGTHANLLSTVDKALSAFQDDLKLLGIEKRVLGVTMSEFGRRILSNASSGTDHGTSAPMFLWGAGVTGGILGVNPTIPATVTVKDNIPMQFDFRSVYASVLQDWLGASNTDLKSILLKDFPKLPVVNTAIRPQAGAIGSELEQNYPNPFRGVTTLRYRVSDNQRVRLKLYNIQGTLVRVLADSFHSPGTYTKTVEVGSLSPGTYFYQLEMGGRTQQHSMEIIR
jgi:uncharacterized protein (DUF1501 family)